MNKDKPLSPDNTTTNELPAPRLLFGRKKLLLILAGVLILCLVGITVGFIMWRTSPKTAVLESMRNTVTPQRKQMKFHATMDIPAVDGAAPQNLTVDGVYKLGAGLSATAVSSTTNVGIKVAKTSNWVIDTNDTIYTNLSAYTTEVVSKTPVTSQGIQLMTSAAQMITKNNKDIWLKTTGSDLSNANSYDLQACTLVTFFKVQSGSVPLQDLLSQLINSPNFSFQKTAAKTYTVTAKADRYDAVGKLYTASDLYKTLTKCDATRYMASTQSVVDTLKNLTVTLALDSASGTISSLTVNVKNSFTFVATLAPTDNVTITIPKATELASVTATTSPQAYLQQNAPYLYKNLMNMQSNIQNVPGAGQ